MTATANVPGFVVEMLTFLLSAALAAFSSRALASDFLFLRRSLGDEDGVSRGDAAVEVQMVKHERNDSKTSACAAL